MTLRDLEIGKSAVITVVGGEGALRQHFLDMGVLPGANVTLMKYAPMGDPMELRIQGYELTLRLDDAEKIEIKPIASVPTNEEAPDEDGKYRPHPGLGESGNFMSRQTKIRCQREQY